MARKFILFGNWKCNGSKKMIADLAEAFNKTAASLPESDRLVVGVCPTALHIQQARDAFSKRIAVGAQNVWYRSGAYTGEWTPEMLTEIDGLDYVIIGHSERRQYWNDDESVPQKVKAVLESTKLNIMLAVGETLAQYEAGESVAVCERQLDAVLKTLGADGWDASRIIIAYEPIFAIGTGVAATPEHAQRVHSAIRAWIRKNLGDAKAEETCIQYGGSVKLSNCAELFACPDVDGGLVGGASLLPDFVEIAKVLAKKLE